LAYLQGISPSGRVVYTKIAWHLLVKIKYCKKQDLSISCTIQVNIPLSDLKAPLCNPMDVLKAMKNETSLNQLTLDIMAMVEG
jgi:hypothetical protein